MTTNKPYPVQKHEYVLCKIDSIQKQTFKLGFNELLNGKKIKGIAVYLNDYLQYEPGGSALASAAVAKANGFLTLKTTNGTEQINRLPLFVLAPGVNTGGTYEKYYPLDNLQIDFEQSYISMAQSNILVAGTAIMIGVVYTDGETTCDEKTK